VATLHPESERQDGIKGNLNKQTNKLPNQAKPKQNSTNHTQRLVYIGYHCQHNQIPNQPQTKSKTASTRLTENAKCIGIYCQLDDCRPEFIKVICIYLGVVHSQQTTKTIGQEDQVATSNNQDTVNPNPLSLIMMEVMMCVYRGSLLLRVALDNNFIQVSQG